MWISMPELEDAIGREAARTLARYKGGLNIYVPHNPGKDGELARIIGPASLSALSKSYGGEYITVPNGRGEPQKGRILSLLAQGKTRQAIAMECGVTERYVYMVSLLAPKQKQLTLPM